MVEAQEKPKASARPEAPEMALGYVVIQAADLDAWEIFGRDGIGFHVERVGETLIFRLDSHARRLIIEQGPLDDVAFVGWEVKDSAALAALRARLTQSDIECRDLDPTELETRAVSAAFRFAGPERVTFEAYHGPRLTAAPLALNRISGFVAEDIGIGHIGLLATSPASRQIFESMLGARHTDDILTTFRGVDLELNFLRFNQRHHAVALGKVLPAKPDAAPPPPSQPGALSRPRKLISHLMMEMATLEDVGAASIRCKRLGYRMPMDVGLHPNDRVVSFYVTNPSGFEFEIGYGAVVVADEASWTPVAYDRSSVWGHEPFGY